MLAAESEQLAAALDARACTLAAARAARLRGDAIAAVNGGRVPEPLQEPLVAAVNELAADVATCVPPAPVGPPSAPDDDEAEEKDEEKGRGKDKDKEKKSKDDAGDDGEPPGDEEVEPPQEEVDPPVEIPPTEPPPPPTDEQPDEGAAPPADEESA